MRIPATFQPGIIRQQWRPRRDALRTVGSLGQSLNNTAYARWSSALPSPCRRRSSPGVDIRPLFLTKLGTNSFTSMAAHQSWWDKPTTPPPQDGQYSNLDFEKMLPESIPEPGEHLLTRRIHILGTGSIGTLVAHALKQLPNSPPITLMLHRQHMYEKFKGGGRVVRLVNKVTEIVDDKTGYDIEQLDNSQDQAKWHYISDNPDFVDTNPRSDAEIMDTGETFIYTLIVAVKGPATVKALEAIKHRVDSRTTILLVQNGMGQIDAINAEVFTDPKTRPTYLLGIISHGCYMQSDFTVVHAGIGTLAVGVVRDTDKYPLPPKGDDATVSSPTEEEKKAMYPTDEDLYSNPSARYLLRTMTRSTALACAAYPYLDLLQLQLEKLVSNCVLNPLTALLDVQNGFMLGNPPLTTVQRLLIAEISLVIRSLPELKGVPNVQHRFSSRRLENFCNGIFDKTARNSSSMREDVRHVKLTEVDFINGYIVKRGDELGIKCVLNYMIMNLIKAKTHYQHVSQAGSVPYGAGGLTSTNEGDVVVLEDTSKPLR